MLRERVEDLEESHVSATEVAGAQELELLGRQGDGPLRRSHVGLGALGLGTGALEAEDEGPARLLHLRGSSVNASQRSRQTPGPYAAVEEGHGEPEQELPPP